MVSCISIVFGIPCTMFTSGNTFACCNPGFTNRSTDSARPTTERTLPFGGGITFAPVWADESGAELSTVGASNEGGVVGVGATAVGGVVCIAGLSGDTGDIGLVGLLIDFLQASDVVTQGP